MLAFHNEHIASCAFLTYFSPESTTAAAAAAAATASSTVSPAALLNDKQAITGITCICCSPVGGSGCRHQPYLHRKQTHQHSKTFIKACFCPRRAMQESFLQHKQQQQQKRQLLHLMQLHQFQVSLMKQQQQQIQLQRQQQQTQSQQQQQKQQQYDMFLASSCSLDKIAAAQC